MLRCRMHAELLPSCCMTTVLSPEIATGHFKLPGRSKVTGLILFKVRFTDFPVHESYFIWGFWSVTAATLQRWRGNRISKTWSLRWQHKSHQQRWGQRYYRTSKTWSVRWQCKAYLQIWGYRTKSLRAQVNAANHDSVQIQSTRKHNVLGTMTGCHQSYQMERN